MPFDPNTGAWVDPTYSTPGGGAFTALRMMNAPATFGAYERHSGEQGLAMLHQLAQMEPELSDAYTQSPEGQQLLHSFGVSPATAQNVLANSPNALFRKSLDQMGEDADTQSIGLAGVKAGVIPAASVLGSFTKLESAKGRIQQKVQQAMMEEMPKLTAQGMGLRDAANAVVNQAFMGDPRGKAIAMEWVNGLSEKELALPAAKATELGARAANEQANAAFRIAMTQPSVDLAKARAALDWADRDLAITKQGAVKAGGLTDVQQTTMESRSLAIQRSILAVLSTKNALGQQVQKTHLTDEEKAYIAAAREKIKHINDLLGYDTTVGGLTDTKIAPSAAGGMGTPVAPKPSAGLTGVAQPVNPADPGGILGGQ
jgi:hypothetical protein